MAFCPTSSTDSREVGEELVQNQENIGAEVDSKELIREQILAASVQPSSQSDIAAMEIEEPHFNITEQGQPEEDNDSNSDFVNILLGHMNEQFRAQPFVPVPRVRSRSSHPQNMELFVVAANRQYRIGHDKRGRPNARLWIDTITDKSKVFLYRYSEADSSPEKDIFVCIACSRHSRVTTFEIRSLPNGELELWEQRSHYPSCYRDKAEVENVQAKYDRTRSNAGSSSTPMNNGEVIFNAVHPTSSARNTGRTRNEYHYMGHRIVAEDNYVFGVNEKASLKTRILVRDEENPDLGRVYSYHPSKRADGRTIFYCRACNPKKYVPVTVGEEDGNFTVREAPLIRHDSKCHAIPFDQLLENQRLLEEKLQRKGAVFNASANNLSAAFDNQQRTPTFESNSRRSPSIFPLRFRELSRSRSPVSRSSTVEPMDESLNGSNVSKRGRKPDLSTMKLVPNLMWRMDAQSLQSIGAGSKIFVLSSPTSTLGREYDFYQYYMDGAMFHCQYCLRLTANRQRTKVYYKFIDGKHVIREGRHYQTCRPYQLQNIPPLLPENEATDFENTFDNNDVEMEEVVQAAPTQRAPPLAQPAFVHRTPPTMQQAFAHRTPPIRIQPPRRSRINMEEPVVLPTTTSTDESSRPSISPELSAPKNPAPARPHDDTEPLPTPPPQTEMPRVQNDVEKSKPIVAPFIEFIPKLVADSTTITYNVPSSYESKVASNILGLEFNKDGLAFWNATYQFISEFKGTSKPSELRNIKLKQLTGFASLAMFVSGDEESAFDIQRTVKRYFYNNYIGHSSKLSQGLIIDSFVTNELTDIHLSVFCKMLGWCVGVFEEAGKWKIYGNFENSSAPTILLKKTGNIYAPVTKVDI